MAAERSPEPESCDVNATVAERILDEFTIDRPQLTEDDLEKLVDQYPDLADELRRLYAADRILAFLESSADVGQQFDEFELLEQIGCGGMGVVYRARQRHPDRIVALKVIRSTVTNAAEIERFREEANAAGALHHPGIVTVFSGGESAGQPYLVMEYIEGRSLAEVVREGPLSPRNAARYVELAADATQHAHQRGIIHRDLKPANILIGLDDRPRITDFGLAHNLEQSFRHTRTDQIVGTLSYLAPEQAAGGRLPTAPTIDVYGLGAVLYELLTGTAPFRGSTHAETLRMVLTDDPVSVRRLRPAVPRDLETIVQKCLRKSPHERYTTALAVADDLCRFLDGEPILARPAKLSERLWKWTRRRPLLAVFYATTVVLVVSLAGWWQSNVVQRELRLEKAEQELKSRTLQAEAVILAKERDVAQQQRDLAERKRVLIAGHAEIQLALEEGKRAQSGWRTRGLEALKRVSAASADEDRPQLRDLAAQLFSGVDLQLAQRYTKSGTPGAVACSPDGRRLAIGELKGLGFHLELVDLNSRQSQAIDVANVLQGIGNVFRGKMMNSTGIRAVCFSPSGNRLFCGTRSGELQAFDVNVATSSLEKVDFVQAHGQSVQWLTMHPDGQRLMSLGDGVDSTLKMWDATNLSLIRTVPVEDSISLSRLIFHPDGDRFIGCSLAWSLQAHPSEQLDAANGLTKTPTSRGGIPIACVSADGRFVAWPSDGPAIMVGTWDGLAINAWKSLSDPELAGKAHEREVNRMEFDATGALLASCGPDARAKIWDTASGQVLVRIPNDQGIEALVRFTPDGRLLAVKQDHATELLDLLGNWEQTSLPLLVTRHAAASISPDGELLACVGVHWRSDSQSEVEAAVWADTGTRLIARHNWIEDKKGDSSARIVFAPNGQTVAFAGPWRNGAFIWDFRSGNPPVQVAPAEVRSLAFDNRGDLLITQPGQRLQCWSLAKGEPTWTWSDPVREIIEARSHLFSVATDATRIGIGGVEGSVILISPDGRSIKSWIVPRKRPVTAIGINAAEDLMAAACQDGKICVYDLKHHQLLTELSGHRDEIVSVDFDDSGAWLVSASKDSSIRLWKRSADRFERFATLPTGGPVTSMSFDRVGHRIVYTCSNQAVGKVWHVDRLLTTLKTLGLDY